MSKNLRASGVSGRDCLNHALQNGMTYRVGKGDHVIVENPTTHESVCIPLHKELATGTKFSILKVFRAWGIFIILCVGILFIFG